MNCPEVSHGLFVEDDESVKTRPPVTEYHLGKTVHDAQGPGPSELSEPMITADPGPSMQSPISLTSTTTLLTTVPFQPPRREDEAPDTSIRNSNPESAFESTNLSESIPQIVCNDAEMLIADVEVKDLNSH
jgi:hypothetical protein